MDATLTIVMSMALAFNLLVIWWKFTHERHLDATLDSGALVTLAYVFGGSTQALMMGTIASAIISIYFLMFPPKLSSKPKRKYVL
jgi:hypothetical protein